MLETAGRVGVLDPRVLRWSLQALLCGRGDEWRRFDALFDAYFLPPTRPLGSDAAAARCRGAGALSGDRPGRRRRRRCAVDDGDELRPRHGASREESLASTDFRDLTEPIMRATSRR